MPGELQAVTKAYDFALWLLPQVAKLPRSHRFTLGDRLEATVLQLLEDLAEAQYRAKKLPLLEAANMRLERLRFLVRLSRDLRLLGPRQYEYAARAIDDIGGLLGGWIRQQRAK